MSNIKRYLDDLDKQILYHEGETEQLKRENKYLKQALKKIMEIIKNC